jgi:hypothetical protein
MMAHRRSPDIITYAGVPDKFMHLIFYFIVLKVSINGKMYGI